jgi:hypothetical protein
MGWSRIGVVVAIACVGCGGANGGGTQGTVVTLQSDAGSSTDGATMDQGRAPHDASPASVNAPEAGVDAVAAVTWTAIYQNLLVNQNKPSNCTGASCHDPGTEKGIDLSTLEKGYTTLSHRVVSGSPDSSELVNVLQSGYMPQGRPQMPAADVDLIRAWISAGALDN